MVIFSCVARLLLYGSAKTPKRGGRKMTEEKGSPKEFSTCMENAHFAEMMQKMMGRQGIGSLCAEMMKKVSRKQGEGCGGDCVEWMQSMMKGCCGIKQESGETKEEEKNVGHQ
jgi:hypothetical protein